MPGIAGTSSHAPEAHVAGVPALSTRGVSAWPFVLVAASALVALVYARPLHTASNYDEEVYLATMRELHHGVAIGDVFLSQPPGFGWFLLAVSDVTSSLDGVRLIMIAISLLGCVAAWFVGRRVAGHEGGLIAAGALAIAPAWATNATRLEAEVPSTTLALAAVAVAARFPLLAGVAFSLAVSMKLLAVSVAVPLALLARRRIGALVAGAAAGAAAVLVPSATHLGQVWNDAIAFHVSGRAGSSSTGENLHRIVRFFDLRTPFAVLALGAIVLAIVVAARRGPVLWPLWTWPLTASATLVAQRPLQDHHMELLAAAWALPIGATLAAGFGRARGRARAGAAATLIALLVAGIGQQWKHLRPIEPSPDIGAAAARLRAALPEGSLVATDRQIVPYLAGDREPPSLVDISQVRLSSGNLTRAALLRDSAGADAFVVGRALSDDDSVLAALAHRYRTRIVVGSITIFVHRR